MTDHLEPEDGPFVRDNEAAYYTSVLASLLLPDASGGLQMVTVPSFHPEEAVYIRAKWDGTYVIATRLEKNLWGALHEFVPPKVKGRAGTSRLVPLGEQRPAVEVARVPIGESLLSQLQLLWRNALFATCYPINPRRGLDGTSYHFGMRCPAHGLLTGQIWSPERGSRMAELVDVGEELAMYARTPEEQRPGAEEALLAKVSALLQRFSDGSPP